MKLFEEKLFKKNWQIEVFCIILRLEVQSGCSVFSLTL